MSDFYIRLVGQQAVRRAIRAVERELGPTGRRRLFVRMGQHFRDMTRRNITSQGDGTYAPLSKWTIARTGRRKALLALRRMISYHATGDYVEITGDSGDPDWTVSQHHDGYKIAAVKGKRMAFGLARPSAIGRSGNSIMFSKRKASKVPARKIWPSEREVMTALRTDSNVWLREVVARWR